MRGFTLIETLIYLSLFSILMTGVFASMANLRSGMERIEASAFLTNEGHYLLERLRFEIENTDITRAGGSSLSLNSGKSFKVLDGKLLEDNALPLNSTSSYISDWSIVQNDGSVEISFLLTVYTTSGNPLSSSFGGVFFPLNPI